MGLGQSKSLRWKHTLTCQSTLNAVAKVIKVLAGRLAFDFPNDLLFLVTNNSEMSQRLGTMRV